MRRRAEGRSGPRGRGGRADAPLPVRPCGPGPPPPKAPPKEQRPFIGLAGPRRPAPPTAPPPPSAPKLMTVAFRPLPAEHALGHGLCAFAPELIAYHQPHHSISGQYRALVDGLQAALPAEQARAPLFTASAPAPRR